MKKIYIKPQIQTTKIYHHEALLGGSHADTAKGNVFDEEEITGNNEPGRSRRNVWDEDEEDDW